jgi:ABC-type sugar transport system substrate-binding protein
MGQIALQVAVRLLEGQEVPEIVVSPMVLVTRDNYSKYFK